MICVFLNALEISNWYLRADKEGKWETSRLAWPTFILTTRDTYTMHGGAVTSVSGPNLLVALQVKPTLDLLIPRTGLAFVLVLLSSRSDCYHSTTKLLAVLSIKWLCESHDGTIASLRTWKWWFKE